MQYVAEKQTTNETDIDLSQRLEVAIEIIKEAGKMAKDAFTTMTPDKIGYKGPQDFLTETDLAVELLIRERLYTAFPEDSVYGEETGGEIKSNTWILDPIDGTANFARGIPHFCIVMAYVCDNDTKLGLIFDPIHDELFTAEKGKGSSLNGRNLQVAKTESFDEASLELGWNQRSSEENYFSALKNLCQLGANVRRSASGALALAYVAKGRTDGYVELHMNPWDCLAGLLLVKESGGVINNYTQLAEWHKGGPVFAVIPSLAEAVADKVLIEIEQYA
ncbi:inositol monophosphatase [Vibrio inusitatus NBRC 102082]|uniref:Inositol-1-monophosphatase n=1 Tax=Vibrio inusitatus NBRC 102082 TaxID=1219070 RepID=A0A4Y3HZT0_9VIBR|nr:inositol monophosphatase family protein [Vibrio inusitatus]GEA52220.1 inositol monophosphatase [Vibrio inusitatus NBRC 102082]